MNGTFHPTSTSPRRPSSPAEENTNKNSAENSSRKKKKERKKKQQPKTKDAYAEVFDVGHLITRLSCAR